MNKTLRVAKTEFANLIRTKAFILSVVLMPVFMGGAIVVQMFLQDKVDVAPRRFAVIDRGGHFFEQLESAAEARNESRIFKEGKQVKPRFLPERVDSNVQSLSDRVRKDELWAYVVIGEDVLEGGGDDQSVNYHSQSPTYNDLSRWIQGVLNERIRDHAIEKVQITDEQLKQLNRRTAVQMYGLVTVTATGTVEEAKKVDRIAAFAVPMAAVVLLFMLVMMAAPVQLNNILEEKMQRISEILVSSVSAFELFLGKLVGIVFVSWTLSALYLGGISFVAHRFGFADSIPASAYLWFILFQLFALLIYGSIFSGLGAACSELRDAQTMMMPAMLIAMIPMFVLSVVMREPNSTFSIVISLFPPATPFLMMMRVLIPPGPAAWELILALVLMVGFTLLCVWGASRIFRIGILSQGQTPSFRKLFTWVFARQRSAG